MDEYHKDFLGDFGDVGKKEAAQSIHDVSERRILVIPTVIPSSKEKG